MRSAIGRVLGKTCLAGLFAGLVMGAAASANAAALGYGDFIGEFRPLAPEFNKEEMVEARLGTELTLVGEWRPTWDTGPFSFSLTDLTAGTWSYLGSHLFEMILTIKYGGWYSAFHYDAVGGGDFGLFSSDPNKTGESMTIKGSGSPYNVAAVRLYSVGASPIPVPGGLVLLLTAVGGLAGFSRLRRTASTPVAIA